MEIGIESDTPLGEHAYAWERAMYIISSRDVVHFSLLGFHEGFL